MVDLGGSKQEQHAAQHRMELDGIEEINPPPEILAALDDTEVIIVHFAPLPRTVVESSPRLRAVIVARAGVENIVEAASDQGVAVVNHQPRTG